MTLTIDPQGAGRFSLHKGDSGHDVVAVQIALERAGLLPAAGVDGIYGDSTAFGVLVFQRKKGLKDDGVAGPATMQAFVRAQSQRFATGLPDLMLFSIAMNESGCVLGARSPHPSDPGFDLGWIQESFGPEGLPVTQRNLRRALSIPFMSKKTSAKIRGRFDVYRRWGKVGERDCWLFAVLYHNWPAAADRLAAGLSIFIDPARDMAPARWVIDASGGRLSTPAQWVESYIEKSTALVRW